MSDSKKRIAKVITKEIKDTGCLSLKTYEELISKYNIGMIDEFISEYYFKYLNSSSLEIGSYFGQIIEKYPSLGFKNWVPYYLYVKDLKEISRPKLSLEEERNLFERVKLNDIEARNKLVEANLFLVILIAKKYMSATIPFADLVQEGNLGLIEAISHYDYNRNVKFSTYAGYWIESKIRRAMIDKGAIIRIPSSRTYEVAKKIESYTDAFYGRVHREPTEGELAILLGVSIKVLNSIRLATSEPISVEMLQESDESWDEKFSYEPLENSKSLGDYGIFENNIGDNLTSRELKFLKLNYGFGEKEALPLESIANKEGITREAVRQVVVKAVRKLENHKRRYL